MAWDGVKLNGEHLFREADVKNRVQLAYGDFYPFDEVKPLNRMSGELHVERGPIWKLSWKERRLGCKDSDFGPVE